MIKPTSETNIIPVGGRVLLKLEIKDFSKLMLINRDNAEFDISKTVVAGTSVEDINIGDEVIVEGDAVREGLIQDRDNKLSYKYLATEYEKLTKDERLAVHEDNTTVDLVEYAIVYASSIRAIIKG